MKGLVVCDSEYYVVALDSVSLVLLLLEGDMSG